ncbi:MAG: DUF805 domain-containing protein [Muribaculaceae bacterium]|nr:DUF805 domain-containing protein [Muribaculaceae bacterium]
MSFSEAIKVGFNKFFYPYGRASRSEFWWYYLCMFIITGVLGVIGGFSQGYGIEQVWLGVIFEILSAICGVSVICAAIRRLHDTSRSGWNILWGLLPLIGTIILIVYWCQASQPGENQYGPEPK